MTNALVDTNFAKWSPDELAKYLESKNLGDYTELFQKNKVDGSVVHQLTDSDLKDMGVQAFGDRQKIMTAFEQLRNAKAQQDRETVLWEGAEAQYWSCCDWCGKTKCGFRSDDPEKYTLKANHLEVNMPDLNRGCCYGHSYKLDTHDLSNVTTVKLQTIPPPCLQCLCCAKHQAEIQVLLNEPPDAVVILQLREKDGQEFSRLIKNQVEVMQRMERS